MDDSLTFDFERTLDAQHAAAAKAPQAYDASQSTQPQPKNYRQTVCTYWLRGLCMKGDTCGFLHQFDPQRMPVCRTLLKFGVCKEPDCPYKHTLEEIKECNMYKLGFCIYGPACRFKHTRLPGPPPEPSRLEACKPREARNINVVANQANDGIAQDAGRPVAKRQRLGGPGEQGAHAALPAPGGAHQSSHPPAVHAGSGYLQRTHSGPPQQQQQTGGYQQIGAYGGSDGGPLRQGPPGGGFVPMQQAPMQQQPQQPYGGAPMQQPPGPPLPQQFGRPVGIDPAVLASVGQANLPYGF